MWDDSRGLSQGPKNVRDSMATPHAHIFSQPLELGSWAHGLSCCLLGVRASAAPYGTSPTCLNPVPSHTQMHAPKPADFVILKNEDALYARSCMSLNVLDTHCTS